MPPPLPTSQPTERRGGLDDAQEFEWGQFGPAERLGKPQAEQTGIGQRFEYGLRQSPAAVEVMTPRGNQRGQRLDGLERPLEPVWCTGDHGWIPRGRCVMLFGL
jgi:hypothetical protein